MGVITQLSVKSYTVLTNCANLILQFPSMDHLRWDNKGFSASARNEVSWFQRMLSSLSMGVCDHKHRHFRVSFTEHSETYFKVNIHVTYYLTFLWLMNSLMNSLELSFPREISEFLKMPILSSICTYLYILWQKIGKFVTIYLLSLLLYTKVFRVWQYNNPIKCHLNILRVLSYIVWPPVHPS